MKQDSSFFEGLAKDGIYYQSLKGIAKMKFDKEHKDSLAKYPELRERMQNLLEQSKTATELVYAEGISYNKKNLERELQNESRQHNRQQGRVKRREEEL